jgi:hypothetical protein
MPSTHEKPAQVNTQYDPAGNPRRKLCASFRASLETPTLLRHTAIATCSSRAADSERSGNFWDRPLVRCYPWLPTEARQAPAIHITPFSDVFIFSKSGLVV